VGTQLKSLQEACSEARIWGGGTQLKALQEACSEARIWGGGTQLKALQEACSEARIWVMSQSRGCMVIVHAKVKFPQSV
jgi:hypothetical protein